MDEIELLYRNYRTDVYRYLLSLTHDPDLAEDLLGETFLAALEGIERFEERCDVKTWLFALARNRWKKYLRRHLPLLYESELPILQNFTEETREADQITIKEIAERAEELLKGCHPQARAILLLHDQGFTYKEIAPKLALSQVNVRLIAVRTKRKLIQCLEEEGFL